MARWCCRLPRAWACRRCRWLDGHERIVRIMPNTPAMIGKGVAGPYAPRGVDEQDRDAAQRIMAAAGSTVWLDEESGIDDITAISGSGPAYVFYFIEGLIDAARRWALTTPPPASWRWAPFEGAVALARHSGEDIATPRANVTSGAAPPSRPSPALTPASSSRPSCGARACRARSVELGVQLSQD